MYILLNTFRQMHLRYRNYYLRDILFWTFKQHLDFCASVIFSILPAAIIQTHFFFKIAGSAITPS